MAMMTAQPLLDALDRAGHRQTGPRRVVARLVAGRSGHFTANDLIADAQEHDVEVGRATIFRALELFTELEVLERIDLPTGDHAYVPCLPHYHHHHIVCDTCGRVTEVEDFGLGESIVDIERDTGWHVDTHRLELFGRCPRCLKAAAS
jgi:Fur family ferric uptake transcriptional regulator